MSGLFSGNTASPQPVNDHEIFNLTTPIMEQQVTLFRHTLYVKIPLDQDCENARLDPLSRLSLRFDPANIDVHRQDSAWVKRWDSTGDDRVNVQLSYPAPIARLHSQLYHHVAVHRVDGEAVSDKPTVSAYSGQAFVEALVAPTFEARFDSLNSIFLAEAVAQEINARQTFQSLSAMAATQSGLDELRISDPYRFVLANALSSIELRGLPSNPRLRMLNEEKSETLWQWLETGEHSETVRFSLRDSNALAAWNSAIARAFAQRQEQLEKEPELALPPFLLLPLYIESDAPMKVVVEQSDLNFLLEKELIDDALSFSFPLGKDGTRTFDIAPPFGHPREMRLEGHVELGQLPWQDLPRPDTTTGVFLLEGESLALHWPVNAPIAVAGVAIAWFGISDTVELSLQIGVKIDGNWSNKSLTGGGLRSELSRADWLRIPVQEIVLQPGNYWLRLTASKGSGLWLGSPCPDAVEIRRGETAVSGVTALPLALGYSPLASARNTNLATPLALFVNNQPLEIQIDTQGVNFVATIDDFSGVGPSGSAWRMALRGMDAAQVTVKSARLQYVP